MKKSKVGIFGLSANPPHKGHIKIAERLLQENIIDKIWFMPCYNHYLNKELVDSIHRIEMLHLAIDNSAYKKQMDVCLYEIVTKSEGKLYNSMNKLIEMNTNTDFNCIIGLDCANNINKWYRWEDLIKLIPFLIIDREGYKLDNNNPFYCNPPHAFIYCYKEENQEIYSSTNARKAIKEDNKDLKEKLLYSNVINYIDEKGLYI
ncbi:MAG: nicotinate (nicotinamide) nucleotide adenylyltransferase [Candidatus Woesearchaeota archaeon]